MLVRKLRHHDWNCGTWRLWMIEGMVGSHGNILGLALVVLITPLAGLRIVFLICAARIFMLTLASAFAPRMLRRSEISSHVSNAAVSR